MAMELKHVKYVVEIKRVLRCDTSETKQFCTKETPTEITHNPYGNRSEAVFAREYEVREVPKVFDQMMSVLAGYDRSPATVTLSFQLIAAENTNTRDPAVAALDSLLRGVLKYSGYRLLRTTVATAGENERVSQSLAADQDSFTLTVHVSEIHRDGPEASVHLTVELEKDMFISSPAGKAQVPGKDVLSTGVTVPIGHTVVLGATGSGKSFLLNFLVAQAAQYAPGETSLW